MSAFLHGDSHLNAILATAASLGLAPVHADGIAYDLCQPVAQAAAGQLWRTENERSLRARYDDEDEAGDAPEPFVLNTAVSVLSPQGLYMALSSLDYQCCETHDWEQTPTARHIKQLQAELRGSLTDKQYRSTASYDRAGTWAM
jgi:hypothetical protein